MAPFSNYYFNFYRDKKSPGKTSFLWPVWVWEILAPKPSNVCLNLFQRSILGLLHCKITDSGQIAEWLGIEKEMVLYIIAGQLQPNGWINPDATLTPEGERLLESDVEARSDLTTAFVFQDALTGKWWPRVTHELLSEEPTHTSAEGHPTFSRDRNSGKTEKPFVVPCSKFDVPTLDLEAMWHAVQEGNNAIHNQNVRDELEYEHREFRADEIECIESKPFPAYLFCWMQDDQAQHWNVTDPLAVQRNADFLRPSVFDAAKKNSALARWFKDYIGEPKEDETLGAWNARTHAAAEFDLWSDFPNANQIPFLEECLMALLRRYQRVDDNGDWPWFYEDWEELVSQSQKVFECCFKWMLSQWPLNNRKVIERNWRYDDLYTALNEVAGAFMSEEALRNLSRQKPGSIHYAAFDKEREVSLRPLIAACLFTLPNYPNHPLSKFTPESLALDTILAMAETRNKVAHASGKKISMDDAMDFAEFTKGWVGTLLSGIE